MRAWAAAIAGWIDANTLVFFVFLLLLLLWPDARDERYCSLCRCTGALSPLKPELIKTHVDDWCAAQTDSQNAYDISSAPPRSDGLERRSSGKAPRPRWWIYSQTRSTGPEQPTHLGPTKTATPPCAITFASTLSALKKSLVANLSAKRQLSVAKLSTKRIFSLAKRDFLVANGRMAADFSSPDETQDHWTIALIGTQLKLVMHKRFTVSVANFNNKSFLRTGTNLLTSKHSSNGRRSNSTTSVTS